MLTFQSFNFWRSISRCYILQHIQDDTDNGQNDTGDIYQVPEAAQKSAAFTFKSTRQCEKEVDHATDEHDLRHHHDHSYASNVTEQPRKQGVDLTLDVLFFHLTIFPAVSITIALHETIAQNN